MREHRRHPLTPHYRAQTEWCIPPLCPHNHLLLLPMSLGHGIPQNQLTPTPPQLAGRKLLPPVLAFLEFLPSYIHPEDTCWCHVKASSKNQCPASELAATGVEKEGGEDGVTSALLKNRNSWNFVVLLDFFKNMLGVL